MVNVCFVYITFLLTYLHARVVPTRNTCWARTFCIFTVYGLSTREDIDNIGLPHMCIRDGETEKNHLTTVIYC